MLLSRRLTFFAIVVGLLAGCSRSRPTPVVAPSPVATGAAPAARLTIVATNDLHGQLTTGAQPFSHGKPVGGAAVLKAYVDGSRQQGEVLLLDAGDFMQGAPESALFDGKSVIEFMNAAGYRAAAVGNHEFDWGLDVLAQRAAEAHFPLLCANLLDAQTSQPFAFTKPSAVVDIAGTKVGLIGVLTESTPGIVSKSVRERIRVTPAAEAVLAQAAAVRAQGAKVVIVLAHLGGTQGQKGVITGEVARLAEQLDGKVDLILSGHTHTKLNGRSAGVLVTQAFSRGTAIAKVDLSLDSAGAVSDARAQIISTYAEKVTPDAAMAQLLQPYFDEVTRKLSTVLGEAADNLSNKGEAQTPMGSVVADAIREAAGAQIAFTNAGGIRDSLPAGKVTMRQVFNVMPFDNVVCRGVASGDTVLKILAHGSAGHGSLQVSGIVVSGKGRGASARLFSGEPVTGSKRYVIAANDFIWEGAEGYSMFPPRDEQFARTLVRDAIAEYVRKHSPLRASGRDRWQ